MRYAGCGAYFARFRLLTARRSIPSAKPSAAGTTQPRFRWNHGRTVSAKLIAPFRCRLLRRPSGSVLIRSNTAAAQVNAVTLT